MLNLGRFNHESVTCVRIMSIMAYWAVLCNFRQAIKTRRPAVGGISTGKGYTGYDDIKNQVAKLHALPWLCFLFFFSLAAKAESTKKTIGLSFYQEFFPVKRAPCLRNLTLKSSR
ncbi:hypothetical protein SDC9_171188 [bioreactor metagenome]|uniref:Uncharacterized protein n=1 Tax=bioreactor metagenome TaxID=1076179 RepID=A0A645GAY5_9ZZZZ